MSEHKVVTLSEDEALEDVQSQSEAKFTREMQNLIDGAEDFRLNKMRDYRTRANVALTLSLIVMMIGGGAFGWLFLMRGNIGLALACMAGAIVIPVLLNIWASRPLKAYKSEFKAQFMPAIAKALGGLKFFPKRGIGRKFLSKTGIIPPFERYDAEDCFMGRYHGAKIIISEARLSSSKNDKYDVFDGIFVMLEMPGDAFPGRTVITADPRLSKALQGKLAPLAVQSPTYAATFSVLSNAGEEAERLNKQQLLKELHEMYTLFDNAPLSAVFFARRYGFIMIPYSVDMFESSNLFVPVTTSSTALQCKKEIDQILSIIDVLELYKEKPEMPGA